MSIKLGLLASSQQQASPLLLDAYPNAAAAYSVRKLKSAYLGSAIRVRRSTDNVEQNIGFNVVNELDITALTSFIGSNTGYISIWYDQSGNSRDAVQTNNSLQPVIVSSGTITYINGKPTIENKSTNYLNTVQTGFNTLQTHSDFVVSKWSTIIQGQPYNGYLCFAPSSGDDFNQATAFNINTGDTLNNQYVAAQGASYLIPSTTPGPLIHKLICHIINSNSGALYVNNTLNGSATGSFGSLNTGKLIIGTRFLGGNPSTTYNLRAYYQEIVTWNSNQSTNRTGIQNNINSYYTIY